MTVSPRSEEQQEINKTLDNKNPEMDKCKQRDTDDEDEENDHNPTAQEKMQAYKAQNFSDMDNDEPTKKKTKNEFSLVTGFYQESQNPLCLVVT